MFLQISDHRLSEEARRNIVDSLGPLSLSRHHLMELSGDWIECAIPLRSVLEAKLVLRQSLRRYAVGAALGAVLVAVSVVASRALLPIRDFPTRLLELEPGLLSVMFILSGLLFPFSIGLALLVPPGLLRKYMWLDIRTTSIVRRFRLRRRQIPRSEAEKFVRRINQYAAESS